MTNGRKRVASASPHATSEEPPSKQAKGVASRFLRLGFQPKHNQLSEVWDEWHGLGRFEEEGLEGGFAKLEQDLKAKWRKHLDAQHVSRVKRVIAGIKARMAAEDESLEDAIAFLDGMFKEGGCSLANLVTRMQAEGLLEKRAKRGGKKVEDNSN